MITFNLIREKHPKGKLARFYNNYPVLNPFEKVLWHLLFINWIPMVISLALLIISAITWNFVECPGFFYTSLAITGLVFMPWIVSGFVNSIKEHTKVV